MLNEFSIGLCYKSGNLCIGFDNLFKNLQRNKICFVIIASDISDLTKKRILDKIIELNIPYCDTLTSKEISSGIGKSCVKILGLLNKGKSFLKLFGK